MFWSGEKALELGLIDGIGQVNQILKNRFGKDVKIKEYHQKKKFFDIGNLVNVLLDILIIKIEEKYLLKDLDCNVFY